MNKENCVLKFVDEIILYYDARSKKHQILFLCRDPAKFWTLHLSDMYSCFVLVRAKLQMQMLAILTVLFHCITQILHANAVVLRIRQWPLLSVPLSLQYSLIFLL